MKYKLIWILIISLLLQINLGQSQNSWIQKASLPAPGRFSATTFVIAGKAYICCGDTLNTGIDYLNDMWEWDQISDTWTQKANFAGTPRRNCIGFSIGTNGYVGGGGTNSQSNLQDFWEYNTLSNTWVQKTNMPGIYQMGAKAFSIGQYGYVVFAGGSVGPNFYKYDNISNNWIIVNTLPFNYRPGSTAYVIGNNAYFGCGAWEKDFWQFNAISETWMQVADFPGGKRDGMVSFSIGNIGYVGTGFDTNGYVHADIFAYNETSNLWYAIANYPGGLLTDAVGFSLNGKGYICTGTPPIPPASNSLWEYSPTVGINESKNNEILSVFPNPFNDKLNIRNHLKHSKYIKLLMYNNNEHKSLESILKDESESIDVNFLNSGQYEYVIVNDNEITIQRGKLIKL